VPRPKRRNAPPPPVDRGTLAKTKGVMFTSGDHLATRKGKPVRVMRTTLRKVNAGNRRLFEDLSYGPRGSAAPRSRRPLEHPKPRPKRRTPTRPKLPPKITQKARSVSTTKRY